MGATISLGGLIATLAMDRGVPFEATVPFGAASGVLVGVTNGLIETVGKVNSSSS